MSETQETLRCRFADCVEAHPVADLTLHRVTCQTCRKRIGLDPVEAPDDSRPYLWQVEFHPDEYAVPTEIYRDPLITDTSYNGEPGDCPSFMVEALWLDSGRVLYVREADPAKRLPNPRYSVEGPGNDGFPYYAGSNVTLAIAALKGQKDWGCLT